MSAPSESQVSPALRHHHPGLVAKSDIEPCRVLLCLGETDKIVAAIEEHQNIVHLQVWACMTLGKGLCMNRASKVRTTAVGGIVRILSSMDF